MQTPSRFGTRRTVVQWWSDLRDELTRIFAVEHCPVVHPFFAFARRDDPLSRMRRRVLERSGSRRPVRRILHRFYWPVRVGLLVVRDRRRVTEVAPGRALFWRGWLALRHNVTLESFLEFHLWEPAFRARVDEYVQAFELDVLLPWLARGTNGRDVERKVVLERLCREREIRIPRTAATVADGRVQVQGDRLLRADLFVKPDDLWGGRGVEVWTYEAGTDVWSDGDRRLDEAGLLRHFARKGTEMPCLVQERVVNGPALDPLGLTGLCTFRVVTTRADDDVSVCFSVFKMPTGGRLVDNYSMGGIAAGVEMDGRLRRGAFEVDGRHEFTSTHPDTGFEFEEWVLPVWTDIAEFACDVHRSLTDAPFMGWDIGWTPDGPILIEANLGWGQFQLAWGEPLGQRFGRLVDRAWRRTGRPPRVGVEA